MVLEKNQTHCLWERAPSTIPVTTTLTVVVAVPYSEVSSARRGDFEGLQRPATPHPYVPPTSLYPIRDVREAFGADNKHFPDVGQFDQGVHKCCEEGDEEAVGEVHTHQGRSSARQATGMNTLPPGLS
ncbi:hypothetical protein V5O48_002301 [Marasmius crinis-equi]|uniref:Uncharacterized protein n=1 Tax=Marasmius crinis-equi TaxID=585013 RepID=A0ABR3FVY6_9AGAR